jgi:hypothetical protein
MSSDDNSVRIHDYSDHAAESIKNSAVLQAACEFEQ